MDGLEAPCVYHTPYPLSEEDCPQEKVAERQDVGDHREQGLMPGVPLFPLHPNLWPPSSRPFLTLRALEYTQDTLPQPSLQVSVSLALPLPHFLLCQQLLDSSPRSVA